MAEGRVESVERALSLLEAFSDGEQRISLAQMAAKTGLYRSTILRLAQTLQHAGYLHRDADGFFRLGPSLWRLGSLYQRSFKLADYVRPALADLSRTTDETSAFYIREGDNRLVLYRHHADRLMRHHLDEGTMLPLDRGAGGRVLRAYTGGDVGSDDSTRRAGFYISEGERDPETSAVAAPVFAVNGRFVGALAVIGSRGRMQGNNLSWIRDVVVKHAADLSESLGAQPTT